MEPKDPKEKQVEARLSVSTYAELAQSSVEAEDLNETEAYAPPGGWLALNAIAKQFDFAPQTLQKWIDSIVLEHPEWAEDHEFNQGMITHYSPELIEQLKLRVAELELPPEGWLTVTALVREFGVTSRTIQRRIDQYLPEHPEWMKECWVQGEIRPCYSPELIELLKADLTEKENAPEGWLTLNALRGFLKSSRETLLDIIDSYLPGHPEWAKKYKTAQGTTRIHYSPKLIERIRVDMADAEAAPEGWLTLRGLAQLVGVASETVKGRLQQHISVHPEWSQLYKNTQGKALTHYAPALVDQLKIDFASHVEKKSDREERRNLVDSLAKFVADVKDGTSPDIQQFRDLTSLLGGERAVDILYQFHPEYHRLGMQYVKSTLGNYLGDFLTIQGHFSLDILRRTGVEGLNNASMREGLIEVVKGDCLRHFNERRREGSTANDLDTILGYLAVLKGQSRDIESPVLHEVLEEVAEYYRSAHEDHVRPDSLVESLRAGREFPDINQKINIKEIADKKKMLIADDMGLGKSASAILAKETLGVKQALVVVPSNVIEVWQNYLSDKVGENGKQLGYFKPGQAPRVLTIEDPKTLDVIDTDEYDYVLISQERLNENYIGGLKGLNNGMLIVDEVHKLKNIKTGVRSEYMLELAAQIEEGDEDKYLALLSGTPVPNKPSDIAMILQLLYPERFAEVEAKDLTNRIIKGDVLDLRSLLVPRMQIKELGESVDMPDLSEVTEWYNINELEQQFYEVLLEEDEITALQKMHVLRQLLMNPQLLDATPGLEGSKVTIAAAKLARIFAEKDKAVMFANGFIKGVIEGDNTIIPGLSLPPDVEVRVITGNVSKTERTQIQHDLAEVGRRMLLLVSGQTADVGVDFSAAQAVVNYNEPWSEYEKDQQVSRVFRPGLEDDLESTTLIARGTFEEGMHYYIKAKHDAVEKVLRGIPISEIEQDMLRKAETQADPDLDVNPTLAEHYFSKWDKMMNIFAQVKELGEPRFKEFLSEYGAEYASGYADLGTRSYQSNATRLSGTVIDSLVQEKRQTPDGVRILDVASGPEMLKHHIPNEYADNVVSLDLNQLHFSEPGSSRVQGSMLSLPIADKSVDYANLSLGLHYTSYLPSRGNFERIEALKELNRVLIPGGTAIVNFIYSLDLKDKEAFDKTLTKFGFRIIEDYSGEVKSGHNFATRLYTLEKVEDCPTEVSELVHAIGPSGKNSLKFKKASQSLRDTRRMVTEFVIDGGRTLATVFSDEDRVALAEEQQMVGELEALKDQYGGVSLIPKEEIMQRGFSRIFNGKRYVLFKKLTTAGGAVVVR